MEVQNESCITIQRVFRGIIGRRVALARQHAQVEEAIEQRHLSALAKWKENNTSRRALTLLGPVEASTLGRTFCREHLYHSLLNENAKMLIDDEKERKRSFPSILLNPFCDLQNLMLARDSNEGDIILQKELSNLIATTIVETTPPTRGRNNTALLRQAVREHKNLLIIAGTGATASTLQLDDNTSAASTLARTFIHDLTKGLPRRQEFDPDWSKQSVNDESEEDDLFFERRFVDFPTGCAGLIGELILSPGESEKNFSVIKAAAIAHHATGSSVPILIVLPPFNGAIQAFEDVCHCIKEGNVAPSRVILSGLSAWTSFEKVDETINSTMFTITRRCDLISEILKRDFNVSIDVLGVEVVVEGGLAKQPWPLPSEEEMARVVTAFKDKKLIFGHSIYFQSQLISGGVGGMGMKRIQESFIPRLIRHGISQDCINDMFIHRPAKLLAWWLPPEPCRRKITFWKCDQCQKKFVEGSSQFTRMTFQYCSIQCLQRHRRGVKAFERAKERLHEGRNREGGKRIKGSEGSKWNIRV
eukprot:g2374.t1